MTDDDRYLARGGDLHQPYSAADVETRLTYGLLYLGLAAFLAVFCFDLHEQLPHVR